MKFSPRVRNIKRRSIWSATLDDGCWTEPVTALIPDDFDDVCAVSRGYASGDYYGMGMLPASQGTVGFLWQFRHALPRTPSNQLGIFGAVDVTLVYQPEPGGRWLHQPGRPDFISHALVPWGQGGIYTASGPVEVGDEHWLFICGATESHAWYLDENWALQEPRRADLIRRGLIRVGVARWPRYRLFGLQADPQGEVDLDLGEIGEPVELLLNYTTRPGGRVLVELLGTHTTGPGDYLAVASLSESRPVEGRTCGDAVALTGESTAHVVAWKDGTIIAPEAGRRVTARLTLEQATVYAYELRWRK